MFKVDILKEVELKRDTSKSETENLVRSSQLLLEGEYKRERDLLKQIGLGSQIIEAERSNSIDIERQTFEKEYSGEIVLKESEIKDIAIKYDLRFLQASNFNGFVDLDIAPKIKSFIDDHKINPSKGDFYILAPGKSFNLDNKKSKNKKNRYNPILFYKVPNETSEHMYVIVNKWGKSFNMMRYIRGLIYENFNSFVISNLIIFSTLALTLTNVFNNNHTITLGNIVLSIFIGVIGTVISTAIRCSRLTDGNKVNDAFNIVLWNSIDKK